MFCCRLEIFIYTNFKEMQKTRKPKTHIGDDYLQAQRKLSREIELERNGGRWIAVDRPHKNKKKYSRKRDRRIDFDHLPLFFYAQKKR